ncbi:hypothetical protein AMS68_001751 [Peltaster fructicola]|uniref:Spt20-like SEP domain-containing protein n=1 Tax=Peltaster fructicola TaxID=286661 RepID=A0A6H0XND9_9PEZI|nr:hypothetical protein AMS68_001751 [Peltaster fructicola]
MASTIVTRPAQTLRRRETIRPSVSTKRGASIDMTSDSALKKRKLNEPLVWDSQYILRKHKGKSPSFTVHLHRKYFRFDGHDSSYSYDGPMRPLIQHLRSQTVPHDLLEELIASNVTFYDGCLIVEVHNHRKIEEQKEGDGTASKVDDTKKLSMHNWTAHVTPSPFSSYPTDAQLEHDAQIVEEAQAEDKSKTSGKAVPVITTLVLHPTAQTQHEEMLILAKTPITELRKKKGADGVVSATSAATPQSALPPTPTSAGPRAGGAATQKMALTQDELYSFQAEMMIATNPPLYLKPAKDAAEADAILDMLAHPLHSAKPPAIKERKRTTAEMAADDAQAAETERRMLIFDERLGPMARTGAGAGNSDNQAAAALGFSRFKTIDVVKQKLAEAERIKKEEESRQVQEKRQQEEQAAQQQKLLAQKKLQESNFQEQARRQQQQLLFQRQQQQEALAKMNGQSQQSGMLPNHGHGLQQNFQQNTSQNQASPIVAQQTPLMPHSSPMVSQNGFNMMANMSQGAASPPRPPSAAMPNGVGMVRGPSQQTHNSLTNTPLMGQGGTPSLANAVPNRQMSQTPRLGPSSPMTGTPAANSMQTPRLNGNPITSQDIMLQQIQNMQQANANNGAGNNGQTNNGPVINPDDVQFAQRMSRFHEIAQSFRAQAMAAQQQGNNQLYQQCMARAESARTQWTSMRSTLLQRGSLAMNPAQGGQTPNMGHSHPKQMQNGQMNQAGFTAQQQQNMQAQQAQILAQQQQQAQLAARQQQAQRQQQFVLANQQLQALAQQHGGQIPQHIVPTLPPALQSVLRQKQQQQQQRAMQMQAARQAQAQGLQINGQGSPPNGQAGYMQNLQALRMQMQQGQQGGSPNMNGMGMNMGNIQQFNQQQQARQQAVMRQQQQQQQGGSGDLSQSFADMQAALQRGHGQ